MAWVCLEAVKVARGSSSPCSIQRMQTGLPPFACFKSLSLQTGLYHEELRQSNQRGAEKEPSTSSTILYTPTKILVVRLLGWGGGVRSTYSWIRYINFQLAGSVRIQTIYLISWMAKEILVFPHTAGSFSWYKNFTSMVCRCQRSWWPKFGHLHSGTLRLKVTQRI